MHIALPIFLTQGHGVKIGICGSNPRLDTKLATRNACNVPEPLVNGTVLTFHNVG